MKAVTSFETVGIVSLGAASYFNEEDHIKKGFLAYAFMELMLVVPASNS